MYELKEKKNEKRDKWINMITYVMKFDEKYEIKQRENIWKKKCTIVITFKISILIYFL